MRSNALSSIIFSTNNCLSCFECDDLFISKAPSLFNEGRRLLLTIYNFGILTLTLLPLSLLLTDMLSTVVKTVGILIALMGIS